MGFILVVLAAILFVYGVVNLFRGAVLAGIILIIAAFLVGPGGYSIFQR